MRKQGKQMTFKKITVAFGLAGALAFAIASPSLAKTKHKQVTQPQTEESADAGSAYGTHVGQQQGYAYLPGYSARPKGMCWVRGGGGGSDLVGDWESCPSK
jgi:hypothetical protein